MVHIAERSLDNCVSLEALVESLGDPERFETLIDDGLLVSGAGHVHSSRLPSLGPLLKFRAVPVVLGDVRREKSFANLGLKVLAVVDVVALDQGQDGADDGLVELILHILQSSVRFDDLVVACALQRH